MNQVTSKCFNPDCMRENILTDNFCIYCGNKLLLRERYRAIYYLGEGGFGRTFVAIDQDRRNTKCVIKQFLPLQQGSSALQKCKELFDQEAQLLDKLGRHPQLSEPKFGGCNRLAEILGDVNHEAYQPLFTEREIRTQRFIQHRQEHNQLVRGVGVSEH